MFSDNASELTDGEGITICLVFEMDLFLTILTRRILEQEICILMRIFLNYVAYKGYINARLNNTLKCNRY